MLTIWEQFRHLRMEAFLNEFLSARFVSLANSRLTRDEHRACQRCLIRSVQESVAAHSRSRDPECGLNGEDVTTPIVLSRPAGGSDLRDRPVVFVQL